MKYLTIFILFISTNFVFAQDENPYHITCDNEKDGENCAVVIAISGLKIRQKPAFDGKQLAIVPFGGKIQRLAAGFQFDGHVYTTDSVPGNWERVRYGKVEGFAFNAFFGEGILKIKEKYTLLQENTAWCWNDCYGSTTEKYNYYAVLKDRKKNILTKFTPTFACQQDDMSGTSIICPDKRPSEFIIVTKEEMIQGTLQVVEKQEIIKGYEENNPTEINQKVSIPKTNWILEMKTVPMKEADYEYTYNELFLRDTKTGAKQQLSEKDVNCESAKLIWCGDLDRDGIMDFMLEISNGDHGGGQFLFLSKDAPKGKIVNLALAYQYWDCC